MDDDLLNEMVAEASAGSLDWSSVWQAAEDIIEDEEN